MRMVLAAISQPGQEVPLFWQWFFFFRPGLRNRQVFFLFMTQACHCNITWNGYKAKPLTPLRGHLRATSNLGIQSTQIYFPSHRKQIKFLSVCLATVARTKDSRIMLVFGVCSVAGYCGHHSGWHSKPGQSINAFSSMADPPVINWEQK